MRIFGLVQDSIVDGPGFRFSCFVQGCPHRCPGCHNPETHPFEAGEEMDAQDLFAAFQRDPLLKGVTLSGGEPFCQPEPLTELARQVHTAGKDVVVFTGYLFEALAASSDPTTLALLQEADLLIEQPLDQVVLHYARCAAQTGLAGVVCSPLEAGTVHDACGSGFVTVTPGVRFADGDAGDQVRVTTPAKARETGSDYIVVGRPITQAEDPVAAYRRCVSEFVG